ncbi:pyridoxamine 5'-phosphate oxidase family protein [Catellatospora sp. NPDC049609]|uniref:pyridoxamine 5'-phosphate oxidase family protein n=1 Tax=Catellatospora sp. NPDC049609 TaxID=3155505 RepID=UPI00343FB484
MRTHPGEVYVQRRAGYTRTGLGSAGVGVRLPEVARQFLARQRMLVIGGHDAEGSLWASPLYGPPGFVRAEGERTVIVEAAADPDDPLHARFADEATIGAIALEPATRRRMRVNGTGHRQGDRLVITADQVFANCPRHITAREVEREVVATAPAVRADRLSADQLRLIAEADTFFIATAADGHGVDVSHRGGETGFVTGHDATTLSWPDYGGNAMFMTLGNLHLQPRCGLLFVDWTGTRPALRLTGRATVDWDPDRAAAHPGAARMIDFAVEQVVEASGPALAWRPVDD